MKSILLLHGWNDENYTTMTDSTDAWVNREKFVKELEKHFKVYKINFPGFCGEPEPNKPWYLKDFASYVFNYLRKNNLEVDYILGYSFGGAVATLYNALLDPTQKIILISPAIARNGVKPIDKDKTPGFLQPLRNKLREIYLKKVIKNPYMVNGTEFLSKSYQNIVRVELIKELNRVNPELLTVIYGAHDEMVNPPYVMKNLDEEHRNRVHLIVSGGHDIANTNTDEIISIISK
jgi:pimeloyl-ACP methyl ester carboxylesterase